MAQKFKVKMDEMTCKGCGTCVHICEKKGGKNLRYGQKRTLLGGALPRARVEIASVPAADTAERLGNPIVANMVILAAYTKKTGIITLEQLRDAVKTLMRPQLHDLNLRAIEVGAEAA